MTATTHELNLQAYAQDLARRAAAAAADLAQTSGSARNACLLKTAELIHARESELLAANAADLERASQFGLSDAQIDRLRLTPQTLTGLRQALAEIAGQPDPIGEVIESRVRPNGLRIEKVRVPLGVVFFIYESRPQVTVDAAAICIKSSNAVILRGGKEAANSNRALYGVLAEAMAACQLPADSVQLVEVPDREVVGHLLALERYIDIAIPRGGEGLIRRVAAEARMPVLKHYTGNCHVYIDRAADPTMAERITLNAKCQRMGVCNAAESLLVHAAAAAKLLPRLARALLERGIELRGDDRVRRLVPEANPADETDWYAEYLGPTISVKVVDSLDEAIRHINHYGSHHTDAIVTMDEQAARTFAQRVDSSAVMINASTRFNDGGELGLGAEIGISTDKLHARGPCGVRELTTYKYLVHGTGHVRE